MFRAHVLIIRISKLYYTASVIITPTGASSCLNTEINIQSVNMDKILLLYTFEVQHDHNSTIEVIPKYFQLQLRCMSQNLCHK